MVKRPEDGSVKHCIGQVMTHQRYHYRGLIYGAALTLPLPGLCGTTLFSCPWQPSAAIGSRCTEWQSKLYAVPKLAAAVLLSLDHSQT